MKCGLIKAYLDSNSTRVQKDGEKKRKPSRIEERIRFRRQLRLIDNKSVKISKDHEDNDEDAKTSCSSSTSSSEINSIEKYRDSKQRVDLLELDQSNRRPLMNTRCKKSKILFKEKINSILMNNHRPRVKQRAKSAPCTPLFQIKCSKINNFVDYKIVQKECIDDTEDDKPIGNELLISVMKESIDKLQAGLKSTEDDQRKPEADCSPVSIEASVNKPDQETGSEVCEKPPILNPERREEEIVINECLQGSKVLEELENFTQKSRTLCHRHCCVPRVPQVDETRRISSPRSCSCSCRVRGQCLRSRSTPRRVTFCVPYSIPEEGNCSDADVDKKPDDIRRRSKLFEEAKFCRCKIKYSSRNRRSDISKDFIDKRKPEDSRSKTSLTPDEDWNTDYDDNKMNCVSFPKETRLAMNVLMHSRDNAINTRSIRPGN